MLKNCQVASLVYCKTSRSKVMKRAKLKLKPLSMKNPKRSHRICGVISTTIQICDIACHFVHSYTSNSAACQVVRCNGYALVSSTKVTFCGIIPTQNKYWIH